MFSLSLFLIVPSQSAFAATHSASTRPSPMILGCLFPKVLLIQENVFKFPAPDRHEVRIRLKGTFNGQGDYCGKMEAEALVFAPALTPSGELNAILFDCNGQLLAQKLVHVDGGGNDGKTSTVTSPRVATPCGSARAVYTSQITPPETVVDTDQFNIG